MSRRALCLLSALLAAALTDVAIALPSGAPSYTCPPDYVSPHGPAVASNNVQVKVFDPAANAEVTEYVAGTPLELQISSDVCAAGEGGDDHSAVVS